MTTYEQGRAPEGAPVTWRERTPGNDFIIEFDVVGSTRGFAATFHTMGNASEVAEAICLAFHVAKLAEEVAAMSAESVQGVAWINPTTAFADWLRRYREAVR